MSTKREVSNISYTNKDFNSIYVELLEYAKKFSYKWDPSVSDESDPGVILLKLAAIIGDKNNYNIDKNVLELMPNSVTQLSSARQLFSQCGYTMSYYKSARGQVQLTIQKPTTEDESVVDAKTFTYTVPRFTMFTDADNEAVFTTIEEKSLTYGTPTGVEVIEGTVVDYSINNDTLITTANLDANNRLYFIENDIAENGIFITNVNSLKSNYSNYEDWYKVDVLETEAPLSTCYRFGLSIDGSLCYIQFPDDAEVLFGEGINIKYIKTKGKDGNIAARTLQQFYVDTSFTKKAISGLFEDTYVSVTTDCVDITNSLDIINGKNPETIEEAYRSYRRVKTTFDTLVSLKDYTDYMVTSDCASNGFVCDRTNDLQRSYKILEEQSTGLQVKTIVEAKEENFTDKLNNNYVIDVPSMNAFNLCVYALEYVPNVDSLELFKKSFQLTEKKTYENFLKKGGHKSLQHDFLGFEEDKILLVKNKYPIICTVVPRYELSLSEKYEIQSNIESALYDALNSNRLDFSEAIKFDTLKETILGSDDRIKHIEGLSTPTYSTWVTYKHDGILQEMRVDSGSFSGGFIEAAVRKQNDLSDFIKLGLYCIDPLTNEPVKIPEGSTYDKTKTYYFYDDTLNALWNDFRAEIYAKNILAGVTPLYNFSVSPFTYGVNQLDTTEHLSINRITTETSIAFNKDGNQDDYTIFACDTLRENESVLLTAPNFVEENNYSSYVKIIYSLESSSSTKDELTIPANTKYELTNNDFIIFFWKTSDSDSSYTYMKYDASANSQANYIQASFELPKKQPTTTSNAGVIEYFRNNIPVGKGTLSGVTVAALGGMTPNAYVKNLTDTSEYEVLAGTQVIKTLKINKIHINNLENGSQGIYWILNHTVKNDSGKDVYRLFEHVEDNSETPETEVQTKYTLKSGEYFLYTNNTRSTLYLLGEGTVIERSPKWINKREVWEAPVIDYSDLLIEGIDLLTTNNCWQQIPLSDEYTVHATEMQQVLIGPGNKVRLVKKNLPSDEDQGYNGSAFSNQPTLLKGISTISYSDESGNVTYVDVVDSEEECWSGSSILNINVSYDTPQKLYENQKFTLYRDNTIEEELEGSSTPLYVSSSVPILKVGGVNLPIVSEDEYVDFITYTASQSSPNTSIVYDNDEFTAKVILSNNVTSVDLPEFTLPQGNYLLQIDAEDNNLQLELSYSGDNITLDSLFDSSNCYRISVTSASSTITLSIASKNDLDKSAIINIKPLFKYNTDNLSELKSYYDNADPEEHKLTFEEQLLLKLSSLDQNGIFNYTSKTKYIENPLVSSSFLHTKHVYCPYTICEWSLNKTIEEDILVMQEIR